MKRTPAIGTQMQSDNIMAFIDRKQVFGNVG